MDATAITLCKENSIPVVVFSLLGEPDSITRLVCKGERIGTCVADNEGSCYADYTLAEPELEAEAEADADPSSLGKKEKTKAKKKSKKAVQ